MHENAFLLITIGPIQDFIASARRCQDLWFGSYLLSYLSRNIAKLVTKMGGAEACMIFPGNTMLDERSSVANRIAALVPQQRAPEIGAAAERLVYEDISELGEKVFARIEKSPLSEFFQCAVAQDQISSMMECFWVAVPCASTTGKTYTDARKRAETLMAARKNTRDWDEVRWGKDVPKSSIDGLRESVVDERLFDQRHPATRDWSAVRKVFGIRHAERICGVGLLKRMGREVVEESGEAHFGQRPVFHSTSHMAAAPLFGHFDRPEVQKAFDGYMDTIEGLTGAAGSKLSTLHLRTKRAPGLRGQRRSHVHDGYLLYEGRLKDLLESHVGLQHVTRDQEREAREALQALLRTLGHQPSPYYALLLADGDRMGVVIDAQESAEKHASLSDALDCFAQNAGQTVSDHGGSLIYSGGDDVLALLPLHRAIPCARALADGFARDLEGFQGRLDGRVVKPTLSVGLAIAHHLVHFSQVREQARRAERLAKVKRNSLAIIIDRRSGGERAVWGSWAPEEEGVLPIDQRVAIWMELIAGQQLSHGFIHEVESLAKLAEGGPQQEGGPPETLSKVLLCELERVMDRKDPGSGHTPGLASAVKKTLRAFVSDLPGEGNVAANLRRLGGELYLSLDLVRVNALTVPPERALIKGGGVR